jgi:hypothetical protein
MIRGIFSDLVRESATNSRTRKENFDFLYSKIVEKECSI